ncbi:hypothetical protein HO173_003152 [Letharia columbiana]|uniref:Uncharacterized protein n=1 Tax=Letharia columbiana TaxID=112416 RepID=A0A8H6L7R1_9LECA|nr:uncharacterized protein HO173_003152 [Letharia columbiana]KAF6238646.1 hypothetical protein HO173_003152 [Letharia columbiana]
MENTAEKPSGNKAPSTKNTAQLSKIPHHMLSTVLHQIITQQAENTTATWPIIPTALRSKRRNYNRQMRRTLREKLSGNKATIVKNTAQLSKIPRHMLSTVPHQIITQQAENTTAT